MLFGLQSVCKIHTSVQECTMNINKQTCIFFSVLSEHVLWIGVESSSVFADRIRRENFQSYPNRSFAQNAFALQNSCFYSAVCHSTERFSTCCGATFVAVFHIICRNSHPTSQASFQHHLWYQDHVVKLFLPLSFPQMLSQLDEG